MMKIINLSFPLQQQPNEFPNCIAAIGFFDGIHKGHQKVIQHAVKKAKQTNMESAVITFHPHPSVILDDVSEVAQYITPLHEKKKILTSLQVDRVYMIDFSKQLSLLSPQQFIDQYIKQLNVKHLIAGFDFTYGHKGAGNMSNLIDFAQDDFTYETIEKVEVENKKVSSTNIRQLLTKGKIEKVTTLLGRHLTVSGRVIQGDQRGATIGFPTANLAVEDDYLLPKTGAYIVEVDYDGQIFKGMANLGTVPTFNKEKADLSLEVHILDFEQSIYGEQLTIKWHQFLRPEKKFSGVDQLVKQLQADEKQVRQYFANKQ